MKNKFRNLFLAFGILAVIIMLFTFDVSYDELLDNLRRAGFYLPLVLVLWLFIYLINTLSWYIILRSSGPVTSLSFARLYKFTVSGFALNYVTPVGLMGGEPYRIMELTSYVGVERATSSVILLCMMHIFSHFCFWLSSVLIYVFFLSGRLGDGHCLGVDHTLLPFTCHSFYQRLPERYGCGMRTSGQSYPFLEEACSPLRGFTKKTGNHRQSDSTASSTAKKVPFYSALGLEYTARIVGCLEVWLILNVLTTDVSFVGCILIVAFSSLLANLLFFLPMQLGGREGGFALAVAGLSLSGAYGVFAALITRVREMVWIVIGLVLMKIGNRK